MGETWHHAGRSHHPAGRGLAMEPEGKRKSVKRVPPEGGHPEPLIRARLAEPGEIHGGAKQTLAHAEKCGWRVMPTYALGHTMWSSRSDSKLIHSLALRMWHPDGKSRAVAVWSVAADLDDVYAVPTKGWKAECAYTWTGTEIPIECGVTDARAYLLDPQPRGGAT